MQKKNEPKRGMQKKSETIRRVRKKNEPLRDFEDRSDGGNENPDAERSEKNSGRRIRAGSIVILAFLLLYLPSLIHWFRGENITTDILRMGFLEEAVSLEGVLVRDETVLKTPSFSGKFIPEILEGERVPARHRVATVLNNSSQKLLDELEEKNLKIIEAQNERAGNSDFFSEDMAKIDGMIGQKVQLLIAECNANTLINTPRLKTEMDTLIEKRAEVAGAGSGDERIRQLKQERDALQKRINTNTGQVTADKPGIVSYAVDGYEEILKPQAIGALDFKTVEGIKAGNKNKNSRDNEVTAGKPFVKIIGGTDFYIVCVAEADKVSKFNAKDSAYVRVNDIGRKIPAAVTFKSEEKGGKCLIALRIDRDTDQLIALRRISIDLIRDSKIQDAEEGLKIPLHALRNISADGKKAKVYLVKANCASIRDVEILCSNREYALIRTPERELKKTVSLYDTYIVNPNNIEEGQIVIK